MYLLLISILIINILVGILLFIVMFRRRKLFQERFAMTMAACASGVISLNISMNSYFIIPSDMAMITIVTTAIGGFIGIAFGSLFKFQSLLAGIFQGMMGGIMGTMLGAVILDPSLCGLPVTYLGQMNVNMIVFSFFGTFIVLLTTSLIGYSLKV